MGQWKGSRNRARLSPADHAKMTSFAVIKIKLKVGSIRQK